MKEMQELDFSLKELKNVYLKFKAELKINERNVEKFGNADEIIQNHRSNFSSIINCLKDTIEVGGTIRNNHGKDTIGINADSINSAIRKQLKKISNIHLETSVQYGSFIPQSKKSDFDFSIYDRKYNLFNLWNYCYGIEARYNGEEIHKKLIEENPTLKEDWNSYMKTYADLIHKKDLTVPSEAFNIVGEIQFGNWAMVYKDMFRLVTATNKKARINLYIYICADDSLSQLISSATVKYKKARDEFEENINNHSINCPVVIIPLDIKLLYEEETKEDEYYIEANHKLQKKLKKYQTSYSKIKKDINAYNVKIKKYNSKLTNSTNKKTPLATTTEKKQLQKDRNKLRNRYKNLEKLYSEIMDVGMVIETSGDSNE